MVIGSLSVLPFPCGAGCFADLVLCSGGMLEKIAVFGSDCVWLLHMFYFSENYFSENNIMLTMTTIAFVHVYKLFVPVSRIM